MEGLAPPDAEISEENWGQRRKKVMAPSARPLPGIGTFSKSEEGGAVFPFPQRTRPEDDHSSGAGGRNFRPRREKENWGFRKVQRGEGIWGGTWERVAAAGEGEGERD